MNWAQLVVLTFVQFFVAAAMFLLVTRLALHWVRQPVARIRVIQIGLAAVLVAAGLTAFSPWTSLRLRLLTRANTAEPTVTREAEAITHSAARVDSSPTVKSDFEPRPISVPPSLPLDTVLVKIARVSQIDPSSVVAGSTIGLGARSDLDAWKAAALALLIIHIVAAVFFLIEWLIGWVQLRSLRRLAEAPDAQVFAAWHDVTGGCGRAVVQLLVSPGIDAPLMFGWRQPVVIVPRELANAGGRELQFCLAHEWSHIDRGDMLSWRFLWGCHFFLWYQPLFWMLRHELRVCQDLLADDRSTCSPHDAIDYSELLMKFTKRRQAEGFTGALGLLDHSSELGRRIKSLLQREASLQSRCTWGFSLIAAAAAVLTALLLGGLRLDTVQADEPSVSPQVGKANKPAAAKVTAAVPLRYNCKVVEKDSAKGIPNARVTVRRSILTSNTHRFIQETQHVTDAQGNYSFEIPPEQVAEGSLYLELDVEHDNYAARKGFGYALSMIRKNEKLGDRPFFERVELYPQESVSGKVLTPVGKPLAGVMVSGFSMANRRDFQSSSFVETKTDSTGKFRLNLHKGVDAVIWIIPKEFASIERFLAKDRGELGEIKLSKGVRLQGRLLKMTGDPVAGVPVNIEFVESVGTSALPVATSLRRGAISDRDGKFAFDPLSSGNYRMEVSEHLSDPLTKHEQVYQVPGIFLPTKLALNEGESPKLLEIKESPHVVLHAQTLNSSGKKIRGHGFHLFGRLENDHWFGRGRPTDAGAIELLVPQGLQKVQLQLTTNEHGALRYRLGAGKPLQNYSGDIDLETLSGDVRDFQIVQYQAPIVRISAFDAAKLPVKNLRVIATYAGGKKRFVVEGQPSDLNFERQTDGRYRSWQMLPDEDATFTVSAPGYLAESKKLKLKEGETRDLEVMLKKDPAAEVGGKVKTR